MGYREMEETRLDKQGQIKFRSDRFYSSSDEWFFCVRRGPDQGTYMSRDVAENALKEFINNQQEQESKLRAERELLYNRKYGLTASTV